MKSQRLLLYKRFRSMV